MRLDDPRLADLAARDRGPVGGRLVRRGVGRPPAVHRGGPARGRRDPPRPPQAVPADLRAVRRAALLRRRATCCGPSRRGSGVGIGIGDLRGLLAPDRAPAAGARRRPDPDQRLVVAGPRPGRDQRGRPRHRDVVADADAHLRPADDVVRRLLQPGRRRRVDLVLGRLRGHRADRRRRSSAPRSTTRACSSSTSPPADIRRERIALPLLRDERPELQVRELARIVAERAGHGRRRDAPSRTPEPGFDLAAGAAPTHADRLPRPRRPRS